MEREVPRIQRIERPAPRGLPSHLLKVHWLDRRGAHPVNLIGWIVTGGDVLAPLRDPEVFAKARVINFGGAVAWDDDGELAIDAMHLKELADEQRPFGNRDVRSWQERVQLSNPEAAKLLGVSISTFNSYKVKAKIPQSIAMICRATLRDPLMMQAHLQPTRPAGRPRNA